MRGLPSIPFLELLKLWGELVEARHGVNGFGGTVAELYAYRFCRCDPQVEYRVPGAQKEQAREAGENAAWLFEAFEEAYRVQVVEAGRDFAGERIAPTLRVNGFSHRIHVAVIAGSANE